MSEARSDAFEFWVFHVGEELLGRDCQTGEKMRLAFMDGWTSAGGDERLAAIDKLQELVHECACAVPEPGGDLCYSCLSNNTIRKLLGEADE